MYRNGCIYDNRINLWSKSIAWSNLNLLESLLDIQRNSLKVDFARRKLSLASYTDVAFYIHTVLSKKLLRLSDK